MNKLFSSRVLISILVFVMLLPSVLPAHAAPTYAAAVKVGDWASYAPLNVTYHEKGGIFPEPQFIIDLNKTVSLTSTVEHLYTTTNVTVRVVTLFINATIRTEVENGDLMTGMGNLTYGLISGGLLAPDPIWATTGAPTINETKSMMFVGESRMVNILNLTSTSTLYGSKVSLEFIWDKTSGILLEGKFLTVVSIPSVGGFVEYSDIKITATNIFSTTAPDFQISVSPTSLSIQAGSSGTPTVTLTSVNGFAGSVSLAATGAYASLSPAGVTLASGGTQTSVLTFSTTATTSPGSYIVTITGTGPLTHHDAVLAVTVTAPNTAPYFTVVASQPASVTSGSSSTSTITVGSVNGFGGTVTLTDTVPSGLTCTAISPSTVTGHGTASLSCTSTTPGTYTVTIKATSGTTSHTTTTTITIAEVPSRTPSAPATIFGLAPTIFYVIIGVIILAIAGTGAYLVLRPKPKETTAQPAPTTP